MSTPIEQRQLVAIVAALGEPAQDRADTSTRLLDKVAKDGWMLSYMLEELAHCSDPRLRSYPHGVDLAVIANAFNLRPSMVTHRPGARSNSAALFTAWSVFDTAVLLIQLNRRAKKMFPEPADRKGITLYASLRTLQLRRLRLPPPKVRRGGAPVPPKAPKTPKA